MPPPLIPIPTSLPEMTPERLILGVTILVLFVILFFSRRRTKEVHVADEDLKNALASLRDGLVVVSAANDILYINPRVEELLGVEAKSLIGRQASGATLKSGANKNLWKIMSYGEEKKEEGVPNEVAIEEPEPRIFQVLSTPVRMADGRLNGFMHVIHDVTEERLVDHMKTSFITILSHSLRTPLAGIKWAVDFVKKEKPSPADMVGIVEKISEQQGMLSNLVEGLVTASELTRGALAFSFAKTDMDKLLNEFVPEFTAHAHEKKLTFESDIRDVGDAYVDGLKLKIAIRHVLDNAVKYTAKGKIMFVARGLKDKIEIKVHDTGDGIPKTEIPKLFSKFYWARNVIGHQHEGTGLGLYTAKSIIEAHGGSIEIDSKEGRGTQVTITVPRKH